MSKTQMSQGEGLRLLDVVPHHAAAGGQAWSSVQTSLPEFIVRSSSLETECLSAWGVVVLGLCGVLSVEVGLHLGRSTVFSLDASTPISVLLKRAESALLAVQEQDDARKPEVLWLADGVSTDCLSECAVETWLALFLDRATGQLVLHYRHQLVNESVARSLLLLLGHALVGLREGRDKTVGDLDSALGFSRDAPDLQSPAWTYQGPHDVVAVFDSIARLRPDAHAVVCSQGVLTYSELQRLSGRIAKTLQAAGISQGDVVAVGLPRGDQAIAAILGVLRAGSCYLPLDPAYPVDRLRYMVNDAGAKCVIEGTGSEFPDFGLRQVALKDLPECDEDHRFSSVPAQARAYIMYTSGSTGVPKGVQVSHEAIVRLVCEPRYMRLDGQVRMLHAAPLGFDASTLEVWGPLLNGGCCVVHDEPIPSGQGLRRTIETQRVNAAWLTAALFNSVVDDSPGNLAGLEQLLIGGEALSVDHVRRYLLAAPGVALINGYGPTETTTFAATHLIELEELNGASSIPIGRPITETQLYVLSPGMKRLPGGFIGELYIGGKGVSLGYVGRPDLDAERFVVNPFGSAGDRLYRTGDLVYLRDDGALEFVGRADGQVKIRGFRIETGEIEAVLATAQSVRSCAVIALQDARRGLELVAYVVADANDWEPAAWQQHLKASLPEFMIPQHWVRLDALPVTANGKLDKRALPAPLAVRPDHLVQAYVTPTPGLETSVASVFSEVLGIDKVGALDNFFDLGGNSLLVMRAFSALKGAGHESLTIATMFASPTPRGIAMSLQGRRSSRAIDEAGVTHPELEPVAIVGMAGRFPGAPDVESFWRMLDEGREAIRYFKPDELDASIPEELRSDPQYVAARGVLDEVDLFDAAFFGISPREAELMDPQQRVFLELCWECLERAGQIPEKTVGTIGVFGGMYNASYFQKHVLAHPDKIARLGEFQVMLANEKDYIATRVAHKLGLTGPAVSVHTACSTSLVAIAQAFDALRGGQCRSALAGGVSITCPPQSGYLYQEGSMLSPDGHTRTFDADAQGTVFSDGAAVVLLKRLSDAIADGNTIHAVIRGVAINNDGSEKASFTAPSVDGQSSVILAALSHAGVDARSVSYVEAHGTATPLGDPVEVEALTQAYRAHTADIGFCALGSLKSNTGHMVIAAGAAGVIKTALALSHERLPPTVHFKAPNPKIDFAGSPFVVNSVAMPWGRSQTPRLAGVSSFGVGGTNAHVILQEAPLAVRLSQGSNHHQLLRLSARSPEALKRMVLRLGQHLRQHPELDLADVAHTLDVGRRDFSHRTYLVAADLNKAAEELSDGADVLARARQISETEPSVVMTFPGQGAQYAGMGRELYTHSPAFKAALDEAWHALSGHVEAELTALMFGDDAVPLAQTAVTQPAIFCIEYALARHWLAHGLRPVAMIGHSIGEFAAAVIAEVMSLTDAARLVALRGKLMQALPPGAMLSVRMSSQALLSALPSDIQLAAENGPAACVVAGPTSSIEQFAADMERQAITVRRLQTSHAFHSAMMDPAVSVFEAAVRDVNLREPQIPIVSTQTGQWLTPALATDPTYWGRHLREPVLFSSAVQFALREIPAPLFVEAGPRTTLTTLTRQHRGPQGVPLAVASLMDSPDTEVQSIHEAVGGMWAFGHALPWPAWPPQSRRRIVLPSYPFERQRYWLDAAKPVSLASNFSTSNQERPMTDNAVSKVPSRQAELVQRLRGLFEDVSGFELAGADADANFVELGLDSLTLTQVALQLKKTFAQNITFRQLMSTYRSFNALAVFLDQSLPQDAVSTPDVKTVSPQSAQPLMSGVPLAMTAAAYTAAPPLAGDTPAIQQIIHQQMQLMAQQLALLQGQPMPLAVTVPQSPVQSLVTSSPAAAVANVSSAGGAHSEGGSAANDDEAQLAHRTYDVKKAFGAIARIHTSGSDMTERQRARLDAFMRRYIDKTKRSKEYTIEHRPHLADPRVVNGFRPQLKEIIYQIVIERSKGARMWDLDGNEYVDALNGFGMSLFGWQPDFVVDAVRRQLDSGYDIGPQHPLAGEVAKLICETTGFDRAGLCNTGSEAVMGCVRVARTVTGRSKIAMFSGAYHGIFDEVIVRGTKKGKAVPAAPGIMSNTAENVVVLDYGTPETLQWLKDNAEELAAVLVEPVQSRRPDFQPIEFLKELRTLTEKSGALLIFDEVVTGFRSHPGGIQALFGIRADLASYGKVVGGGFPIGVIAGKREYMDALDGGHWEYGDDSIPTVGVTYFAGTFVRHPLALVAAKAVLDHVKQEGPELQAGLTRRTSAMVDELNAYCREVGAPITLKSFSSVWKVFFDEEHPLQDLLFAMMRNRGVHILDNFPCFMTTAHTDDDIHIMKRAFKDAVSELQESDFLPRRVLAKQVEFDATRPPVPGARLGRDAEGNPGWFVPNPQAPGKYIKVEAQ